MTKAFDIYKVDAFTDRVFGGNPAAVVPLDEWLDDKTLTQIAAENNLSETAFFVKNDDRFHLRWFTPTTEVSLCGHATLATTHVLYTELGYDKPQIKYETQSDTLTVKRDGDAYILDFPAWPSTRVESDPRITQAFEKAPTELFHGKKLVAVYDDPKFIRDANPDIAELAKIDDCEGIIITAAGDEGYDCVSRYFGPQVGINEDPVTGSAHCLLTPIWAEKLGKNKICAYQASARGGEIECTLTQDRVHMRGQAVMFLKGQFQI